MKKRKLKVGFDLDGVLLYNPMRAARPFLKFIRKYILNKKSTGSYVPKTPSEELLSFIYIKLSILKFPGYKEIIKLIDDELIDAYIITARHESYKKEYEKSIKKLNINGHFKDCFYNEQNLEPYEFKRQLIDKLNLDYYIDDNYDVITNLSKSHDGKIFWITNILDSNIEFKYKFFNLYQVAEEIRNLQKMLK